MTDKRFVVNGDGIYDHEEEKQYLITAYAFYECEIDQVVHLLNELAIENEKLHKNNFELYFQVKEKDEKIQDLESQLDKFPPKIRELWIQD